MRCLWCRKETTTEKGSVSDRVVYANLEHIFPESIGGKKCLEQGKVCEDCNNRLGRLVDPYLRENNTMMSMYWQSGSLAMGRPIGKKGKNKQDKERKQAMMSDMTAFNGGTKIQRTEGFVNLTNVAGGTGSEPFDEQFSRALHKCAVNLVYDVKDYTFMQSRFPSLIEFVGNLDNTANAWAYGICYAKLFESTSFEPMGYFLESGDGPIAAMMFFPALIAIVGLQPNILHPSELEKFTGDHLADFLSAEGYDLNGMKRHYNGGAFPDQKQRRFGSVFDFQFRKQLQPPQPRPDGDFHVLFRCDTCGQINPSGLRVDKREVLEPWSNHTVQSRSKGWNVITKEDLRIQGLHIEKCAPESLDKFLKQPFQYPRDREFVYRDMIRCQSQKCINCGMLVSYSGEDLFI